jgi:hypothetical protein
MPVETPQHPDGEPARIVALTTKSIPARYTPCATIIDSCKFASLTFGWIFLIVSFPGGAEFG